MGPAKGANFGYTNCPATNTVYVLPSTGVESAPAWTPGTLYRSGSYVSVNDGIYMAVIAGTSGTNSGAFVYANVTDGTIRWHKAMKRTRKGMSLTIDGTGDVYVSFPSKAAAGCGTKLAAGGGPYVLNYSGDRVWQGEVTCYSTDAFSVYGQEW